MKTIKRFHYTPLWKIEKTEQWLAEMEQNGYRLEKISCFGLLYHFKCAKSRSVNYLFWFDGLRADGRNGVANDLIRRLSANEVRSTITTSLTALRITAPCDLTFELDTRAIYFRVLLLSNFLTWLFCNLYGTVFLYAVQWMGPMLIWAVLTGVLTAYYLYGVIRMTIQIGKINRKLKK